ncbi:sulfate permease family protein [Pseudomonas sp. SJZ080]|nr:sulfate permease family protein [Pseudomonas sp. SJZ080]
MWERACSRRRFPQPYNWPGFPQFRNIRLLFPCCVRSPMKPIRLRADVLAGLTTSFALLPECIAFALVAHLNPLMGLYGAFIICTLTALFGGRPGMVSGAAGSMAVVIVALVVQHGVQYLLATVLLGGLIMLAFGLLKLGKLVRMVPHPVMLGFVNGLAIIIALAQLEHFKSGDAWLSGTPLYVMSGLVALTMAIVYLLPRLTRAVPPALVAILGGGWRCICSACRPARWATWRTSPVACRRLHCRTFHGRWTPCASSRLTRS